MQQFDHEKLDVYQRAIQFVAWSTDLLNELPKVKAVHSQLDRAATSIPLNLAEGNGKYTAPDRCRYFDIARGSGLECAACLDVLAAKGLASEESVKLGKSMLGDIVSMIIGLIRANSEQRSV